MATSSDKSEDSVLFYFISVFCACYFSFAQQSVLVSMSKKGNQTIAIETSIILGGLMRF